MDCFKGKSTGNDFPRNISGCPVNIPLCLLHPSTTNLFTNGFQELESSTALMGPTNETGARFNCPKKESIEHWVAAMDLISDEPTVANNQYQPLMLRFNQPNLENGWTCGGLPNEISGWTPAHCWISFKRPWWNVWKSATKVMLQHQLSFMSFIFIWPYMMVYIPFPTSDNRKLWLMLWHWSPLHPCHWLYTTDLHVPFILAAWEAEFGDLAQEKLNYTLKRSESPILTGWCPIVS